jgi:hypothetical protein
MKNKKSALRDLIRYQICENQKDFYESRIQTLDGSTAGWATPEHIKDLEQRCAMLKNIARQQRPRTASRQAYSAAHQRCKAQLAAARRHAERREAAAALETED